MLKQLMKQPPGTAENSVTNTTAQLRMKLEERQVYRREMLYQSIRECLQSLQALPSMYRFQVFPADERHHHFNVRIEVSSMFAAHRDGLALSPAQIETLLRQYAYLRHGVQVDEMHWHVDENQVSFIRARRTGDTAGSPLRPQTPTERILRQRLARRHYEPVSARERELFMQALQLGQHPPPIRVGMQTYQSDLMPLRDPAEPDPPRDPS